MEFNAHVSRPLLAASLVIAALAVSTTPAPACGVVIPPVITENAAIDAQRALFVWRGNMLDMHLQLSTQSDSGTLAWVLPVNGTPEVAEGDNALFEALDALTQPTITLTRASPSGVCAGDAGAPDVVDAVTHLGGGVAGVFEYELLGGSAAAVTNWLGTAGYPTPDGLEASLEPYVEQGLRFLAVKVSEAPDTALLPPLKITVSSPGDRRARFPLGLSASTSGPVTPILWYVLADTRFRVANAGSMDIDLVGETLRDRLTMGAETGYDAAIDDLTSDAGGRLVVTEFAQDLRDTESVPAVVSDELDANVFYLTRLFARIPKASLADMIITFANDAPDVSPMVVASRTPSQTAGTGVLLLLALLSGQWLVRRRG